MLPYLDTNSPFPPVGTALTDPNGLLAAGADLSQARLLTAYSQGIFPWYSDGEPILWWSPNPRTVFSFDCYKPSKSLCRFVKHTDFKVTLNHDFEQVIELCAEPRQDSHGTWITDEMKQAYIEFHNAGFAHSVEVWQNETMVGGIYGVSIGKLFCGESMFSRVSNGSKLALSSLIGYLKTNDFQLLDCQIENPHLMSLGAINIDRKVYLSQVKTLVIKSVPKDFWKPATFNIKSLVRREPVTNDNLIDKNKCDDQS